MARLLLLWICFFEDGNPSLGAGLYELEVGQVLESKQFPSADLNGESELLRFRYPGL